MATACFSEKSLLMKNFDPRMNFKTRVDALVSNR